MRPITRIVVHCSDSHWGSLRAITQWHKERGLTDDDGNCGYHYIILNGYPTATSIRRGDGYIEEQDGEIIEARPVEFTGAHCRGWNRESIGICLIGKTMFSERQVVTLIQTIRILMEEYNIRGQMVFGHREFWESQGETTLKTCPNFHLSVIRQVL